MQVSFPRSKMQKQGGLFLSYLQESRGMESWSTCRKWSWSPLLILRHLTEDKPFTSQDDHCSWGVVLGQNSVSVLTCPFPLEVACFPGISIPTMFCFKLPAVQQLAPQISECLTIKSCKLMQVSFNKPREEHVHILLALLLGCCHTSAVPGETQNTGFSVDAYPLHHPCAPPGRNPGSLGFWITSFTSTKDPPSVGSKALSYWEIQYYSAGTFELKITFEKDYPGQSHQLLCTQWT